MEEDKNKKAKPKRDANYLLWFLLPGIIAILWGMRSLKGPVLTDSFSLSIINIFSFFIILSLVVGGVILSCTLFIGGLAVESIKTIKENNEIEEEKDKQDEESLPEIDSKEASESTTIMVITCIVIVAILDIFVFDTHIIKFIIEIIRDVVNIWR